MRPSPPGWRTVVTRVALALVSFWVALSMLFLLAMVLPGDFLAIKLANLENQGAGQRLAEVIGQVTAKSTTKAAGSATTLCESG